jgi:hypothetical protein
LLVSGYSSGVFPLKGQSCLKKQPKYKYDIILSNGRHEISPDTTRDKERMEPWQS